MKSKLLLMGILMCSGIFAALAQSDSGEIRGKVIEAKTKKPLGYVSITLLNSKKELLRELFTDSNGSYTCSALPPGDYELRFVNFGYGYEAFTSIAVDTGKSTYHQVKMKELEGGIRITSTCRMRITPASTVDTNQTFDQQASCGFVHKPKPEETKTSKPAPDELFIIPIPASNTFKVETLYDGKKNILIQSIAEHQYVRETFTQHTRVNISSFPKGMYLITITDKKSNDKTYVKLIIDN